MCCHTQGGGSMTQHAQYGRHWGKRLLGMAIAIPMTLAGLVTGAATWSTATAADTSSHLIAQYEFNKKPTDGKTVVNTANTQIGSAVVQQSSDALWKDGALTLQGGDKSQGDWVRLPDNILSGKTALLAHPANAIQGLVPYFRRLKKPAFSDGNFYERSRYSF